MNAKYEKALEMATAAYQGKKDSLGNDFIDHSINVSNRCRSINEKLVALLVVLWEELILALKIYE